MNDSLSLTHRPSIVTKQLKFNVVEGRRKIRLSSNFLALMNFNPGMDIKLVPNGNLNGFSVSPANSTDRTHQVYKRGYQRQGRSNNPFELVMEFSSKSIIDQCFPSYTERFHVEMKDKSVLFVPLKNRTFSIINKFRKTNPFHVLTALSGGVDTFCMERLGWKTEILIEHRPSEKRDVASGRNLTEVHALNSLFNSKPRIVCNEDIYHLEIDYLEQLLSQCKPIGIAHYSLGCDDHSTAKSKSAKSDSVSQLSTMVDMIYPALRQIETVSPAVVVIENVKQFLKSAAADILLSSLRRMGYFVNHQVLDARDFGGVQSRERSYLVASIFPSFTFPDKCSQTPASIQHIINKHITNCSDVTDTKMIRERDSYWRNMPPYLTVDSTHCPTIMKSQDRVRDGVYVKHGGRIYKPTIDMLKDLMSIPESFNVDWMAKEQATETLGQSIDYKLHHAVLSAVHSHLLQNCGRHILLKHSLV